MKFEVYCDESGLEALNDKQAHLFSSIGGIWMPSEYRSEFKEALNSIKEKHNIHGEFKWNKVSPSYLNFYSDIIDFFFSTENLRFRVILMESDKIDNYKFHNGDSELGFYKFYYQLLHHWILDFNEYDIFLDLKVNRDRNRLNSLNTVLDNSNLTSNIKQVQGLPSDESLGIQLADLLTGLVGAKFNNKTTSEAKLALINKIEREYINKAIGSTPKAEEKFNVFKINLNGGW